KTSSISNAISTERKRLDFLRNLADVIIDTSKFNVHELRSHIIEKFQEGTSNNTILVSCVSFGFKNGVPNDADLVFDVRFLPNPHFVPEFRPLTGRHPKVAAYIRQFPQTLEFIDRISELLVYLMPHYIREGKSYLTVAFGCTGGQHRSVMIAADVAKRLSKSGYKVKAQHRDSPKESMPQASYNPSSTFGHSECAAATTRFCRRKAKRPAGHRAKIGKCSISH